MAHELESLYDERDLGENPPRDGYRMHPRYSISHMPISTMISFKNEEKNSDEMADIPSDNPPESMQNRSTTSDLHRTSNPSITVKKRDECNIKFSLSIEQYNIYDSLKRDIMQSRGVNNVGDLFMLYFLNDAKERGLNV